MDNVGDISDLQSIKNEKVTEEKMQYLKNIYQKCKWYYWLHTKTYYYLYKVYIGLHIPMIIVNLVAAILNANHSDSETYNAAIKYCSAVILLLNTFFASLINLLKVDKKLEYHKSKASDYISLSNEIEEYIMVGEEIEPTIRLYKTYLSFSTDNEYVVPERIIKSAEKTLNNKYINKTNNNDQIGSSSFTYIGELISEIKKENKKTQINFNSDEQIKIKQLLATKQTPSPIIKYADCIITDDDVTKNQSDNTLDRSHDLGPYLIENKSKIKKKKPSPVLNIDIIDRKQSKSPTSAENSNSGNLLQMTRNSVEIKTKSPITSSNNSPEQIEIKPVDSEQNNTHTIIKSTFTNDIIISFISI